MYTDYDAVLVFVFDRKKIVWHLRVFQKRFVLIDFDSNLWFLQILQHWQGSIEISLIVNILPYARKTLFTSSYSVRVTYQVN